MKGLKNRLLGYLEAPQDSDSTDAQSEKIWLYLSWPVLKSIDTYNKLYYQGRNITYVMRESLLV